MEIDTVDLTKSTSELSPTQQTKYKKRRKFTRKCMKHSRESQRHLEMSRSKQISRSSETKTFIRSRSIWQKFANLWSSYYSTANIAIFRLLLKLFYYLN